MPHRSLTLVAVAAAGLTVAASARATEGPPAGGPPLPNPMAPVVIPPAGQLPMGHAPVRLVRPRIVAARITPRRVVRGHKARLRILLAHPGRVRIVIDRRARKHRHRVLSRTINAPLGVAIVRLPAHLRVGHYRVTVIALGDQGQRSRPVHRRLTVVAR
jgi:hypothetical protein